MTKPHDASDDLLDILDALDELIATARSMPMSASAIVNRDDALDLIDRARRSVPTAIHRAQAIVADADAVLARSHDEAERIVVHAHEEAEQIVAGENIVRMSNDRADEIIAAAEERASALRRGADEYSDRSLATLEAEVAKISEQIRSGREVLASRLGAWDGIIGGGDADSAAFADSRRSSW